MEHTSQMPTLSEGESLRVNDEIMVRRLKNRERQRRYRAKKRLEADMRKSYMILQQQQQQEAMWSVEPQSCAILDKSETSEASEQANSPTTILVDRVYSGRKWKKDARRACASEAPENQSAATTSLEADANTEHEMNLNVRRDWKGDARNKIDMVEFESVQQI